VCDWMLRVAKKDEVCRWSFSRGGRVGSVYVRDGWRRAVGGKWSLQVPSQTGGSEEFQLAKWQGQDGNIESCPAYLRMSHLDVFPQ
jgi:hypothetical protein